MQSNVTIALLMSLGFSAWIYAKVQRSTANNTQSSLVVAGATALITFFILLSLLNLIPTN